MALDMIIHIVWFLEKNKLYAIFKRDMVRLIFWKDVIVMIKYYDEEGFIKPTGIKFREGQDENVILPKVAVGVFSRYLFFDVVEKYSCKEVGYISSANMERNVYILRYRNIELTFFMAGVSGPWISSDIEVLHAQGVKKVIIIGTCGVLDSKIDDCSILIPTRGFRDEGTSYHYLPDSESPVRKPALPGKRLL